jgi:hypothetical protein
MVLKYKIFDFFFGLINNQLSYTITFKLDHVYFFIYFKVKAWSNEHLFTFQSTFFF